MPYANLCSRWGFTTLIGTGWTGWIGVWGPYLPDRHAAHTGVKHARPSGGTHLTGEGEPLLPAYTVSMDRLPAGEIQKWSHIDTQHQHQSHGIGDSITHCLKARLANWKHGTVQLRTWVSLTIQRDRFILEADCRGNIMETLWSLNMGLIGYWLRILTRTHPCMLMETNCRGFNHVVRRNTW